MDSPDPMVILYLDIAAAAARKPSVGPLDNRITGAFMIEYSILFQIAKAIEGWKSTV